jgi:tricorn protease-like protein
VHLFPATGGKPVDLAGSLPADYPSGFTADGKGLYVSRKGIPCSVDLIDLATGRRTHVRDLVGADSSGVTDFGPARATPDGATMTAGTNRILSTLYRVQGVR